MSEMTISEFCDLHDACSEGRDWALATGCITMAELWQREDIKYEWRMWIATCPGVMSDRDLRLFACWCVRQVWPQLIDQRSRNAVEVAEKYAVGEATEAELSAARDAAWAVTCAASAAAYAARAAASAADDAAYAAAYAADHATSAAASAATRAATRDACAADWDASAAWAATCAARGAAWAAQSMQLKTYTVNL